MEQIEVAAAALDAALDEVMACASALPAAMRGELAEDLIAFCGRVREVTGSFNGADYPSLVALDDKVAALQAAERRERENLGDTSVGLAATHPGISLFDSLDQTQGVCAYSRDVIDGWTPGEFTTWGSPNAIVATISSVPGRPLSRRLHNLPPGSYRLGGGRH